MSRLATGVAVVAGVAAVGLGVAAYRISTAPDPAPVYPERTVTAAAASAVDLPHLVEVPATADSCPAHTFRLPSEPMQPPQPESQTAAVKLDENTFLLAVCLGTADQMGPLDDLIDGMRSGELDGTPTRVEVVRSAYGEAYRVTNDMGASLLSDHYVERDGWLYAVGYLRREATGDHHQPLVDAVLASWVWE